MSVFIARATLGGTGRRVAIKDSIDMAGYTTTAGSRALTDTAPATHHARVVELLIDAGWQIVGKTNMHELAFGVTGINEWSGTPINPQDALRIPGGSSSGSAVAVAGGHADVALGTDTGGSVRVPAACCGVVGLKPSFGRVDRTGVHPGSSTLDCVGPFARSMEGIIATMRVISPDFDKADAPVQRERVTARIGLVECEAQELVHAALHAALLASGWATKAIRLANMDKAYIAGLSIINAETWAAFGHLTGRGLLGADVEARLRSAGETSATDVDVAEAVRKNFTGEVDAALQDFDALILPTLPMLPPSLKDARESKSMVGLTSLVRPFNLSGHPALSIPVPVAGSHVKAGLQLVGRRGNDEQLCALGSELERVLKTL